MVYIFSPRVGFLKELVVFDILWHFERWSTDIFQGRISNISWIVRQLNLSSVDASRSYSYWFQKRSFVVFLMFMIVPTRGSNEGHHKWKGSSKNFSEIVAKFWKCLKVIITCYYFLQRGINIQWKMLNGVCIMFLSFSIEIRHLKYF